ncbi:uncharacterized protein LOC131613604 [Vicia villosa]|uniref:uncharacterized protein LOC131613604 n=1 Tax=Vicia villosa TaxID=3911 RepID=UPI00273B0EE6|nr:uncharacterized protein LOC131613604 [Vicia villosa]
MEDGIVDDQSGEKKLLSYAPTTIHQAIVTATPAVINTIPLHNEQIFHGAPSKGMGRLEEFEDQFLEMQKEIKSLRGKDLFGKEENDLCLVPNVRVPTKFRLPEFEKYKGNFCPHSHLIMYVRKMSMHTEDQCLLIHYFQDSLFGAALEWYMGLDSTHIRTFHNLDGAFIRQYKYKIDLALDRDQLCAMFQREKESFKEYAQRWRELAAQILPPMEEKEMIKVFLKTLSTFYYEKMVASAPNDFTEMNVQKPQPQQPRQHAPQQNQQRKYPPFDPILMTYTELLPLLLQKNLVQLRDPPPPLANPPFWYKADARCAFHKNAPVHTVENCYPLMSEVQKLV